MVRNEKNGTHRYHNVNYFVESLVQSTAFPVIHLERGRGRAFLDTAASSQKHACVINKMNRLYTEKYANVHRGLYQLSEEATVEYEKARIAIGKFINAAFPTREIVLCSGATEAINMAAHSWGNTKLKPGDEIVVTTMEHHSNLVPWQMLAKRTKASIVEMRPDRSGRLTPEIMESVIGPRTKMVAITHVSNVLGVINDIKRVSEIAHKYGAIVLADGAQALGHLPVDVQAMGCDLYVGSSHKMFGPTGAGFLYGKKDLLETFEPFLGGGDMIEEVHIKDSTYAEVPERLEAGTPNIAGVVGMGEAASVLSRMRMKKVRRHDKEILNLAMSRLQEKPWLELYGPKEVRHRSGLISFNVKGVHAHDVASILNSSGVSVRAGHLCAQPLMRFLGVPSCVRASFALYNDFMDVELLIQGLEKVREIFGVHESGRL